jgi:hypothetical protein
MPVRFVKRYKVGFEVIIETADGDVLLGGRQVYSGAVFDTFFDALLCMNLMIESNQEAKRRVSVGKVVEFRGMVSTGVLVPDRRRWEPR